MIALFLLLACAVPCSNAKTPLEFFVATNGNDNNPGTLSSPFATLERARDAIRTYKAAHGGSLPTGGATVNVRGGTYTIKDAAQQGLKTSPMLTLETGKDGGSAGAPVIYRAYEKESVTLSGGVQIPVSAFSPVGGKTGQYVADVSKFGLHSFGELHPGGLGTCASNKAEVTVNGQPMILARYPNIDTSTGLWKWMHISKVKSSTSFTFTDKVVNTWKNATDGWLHGYWKFDWADSYVKIASIDTSTSTITTEKDTPPVYGYEPKARFYGVNLLVELDAPGEYYIDRVNKKVYIIPMTGKLKDTDVVVVSQVQTLISIGKSSTEYTGVYSRPDYGSVPGHNEVPWYPPSHLFERQKAAEKLPTVTASSIGNIQLINFKLEHTTLTPLMAIGNNITISGVSARLAAADGMVVHGYNNTVTQSLVEYVGCVGVSFSGGDTQSLTRSGSYFSGNTVQYYARWKRTYQPGIGFSGVGLQVLHNHLYNAPHQAFTGSCNDCKFSYNNVTRMCYEVLDSGAWYAGRSWVHRGSEISYNLFQHIQMLEPTALGSRSVQGVYFDDQLSAHKCFNNTFYDVHRGILVGGGRRHQIHDNFFKKATLAISLDDRGETWQKQYCTPPNGKFFQELEAVHYKRPPWSTHYPNLPNIANEHPCLPVYNVIVNNTWCCDGLKKCKFFDQDPATVKKWMDTVKDNVQKC